MHCFWTFEESSARDRRFHDDGLGLGLGAKCKQRTTAPAGTRVTFVQVLM